MLFASWFLRKSEFKVEKNTLFYSKNLFLNSHNTLQWGRNVSNDPSFHNMNWCQNTFIPPLISMSPVERKPSLRRKSLSWFNVAKSTASGDVSAPLRVIHSKSEKNGGVYFWGQKNWRKKCVNGDNKFLQQMYRNHENASNFVAE